jgi:Cu/Zn superoxide dismutase
MGAYPGYTPGIAVMGTVVVKDTGDGITLTGTLGGLETDASGGIHIHTGVTCDDASLVGGHYFPGMASDPWTSTMWSSDSMGSSTVDFTTPSFSLTGVNPVANRAVVVHDSSGNRIACGMLMPTVGEVVTLGPYPGNTANTDTTGTLVVTQGSAGVSIMGTVTHVEASCTNCGLHIHTGTVLRTSCLRLFVPLAPCSIFQARLLNKLSFQINPGYTCDDASAVGGHFYDMSGSDPWASTSYTSNANGVASVAVSDVAGFTTISASGMPTAYRTVVLHNDDSSVRSGCGVIGAPSTAVASMMAYPGYTGAYSGVMGTIAVSELEVGSIKVFGTLTGLEAGVTGGIHIHTGVTCDDALLVGGHY